MSGLQDSKWLAPGPLLGVIGMLGTIGAAWMMFDARLTAAESDIESLEKSHTRESMIVSSRLDRIENKLDRVIEKGIR